MILSAHAEGSLSLEQRVPCNDFVLDFALVGAAPNAEESSLTPISPPTVDNRPVRLTALRLAPPDDLTCWRRREGGRGGGVSEWSQRVAWATQLNDPSRLNDPWH